MKKIIAGLTVSIMIIGTVFNVNVAAQSKKMAKNTTAEMLTECLYQVMDDKKILGCPLITEQVTVDEKQDQTKTEDWFLKEYKNTGAIDIKKNTAEKKDEVQKEAPEEMEPLSEAETVYLYEKKKTDSEVLGILLDGYAVEIKDTKKKWYQVTSGEHTGYIQKKYVVTGEKAKQKLFEKEFVYARINAEGLKVRNKKSRKSVAVGFAGRKTEYPIVEIGRNNQWVKIKRTDNIIGWIPAEHVDIILKTQTAMTQEEYEEKRRQEEEDNIVFRLEDSGMSVSEKADKIITYAKKFLGNKYVWGGTSLKKGTDCSGFTMSVFAHFGYKLNRTSYTQVKNGIKVADNTLMPGDLVFYKTGKKKKRIGHVALYIGSGKIIHAKSKKDGIVISGVGKPCAARRIIK